ncbi:hypothetical protein SH501x_002741 [Pirellulaceae bacterium SH501]
MNPNERDGECSSRNHTWAIPLILSHVWFGALLYAVRATLVFLYSLTAVPIGGPGTDAAIMMWIPFFVVDIPWSLLFESVSYSSNETALVVYALFVGIPWIIYGFVLQKLFGSIRARW